MAKIVLVALIAFVAVQLSQAAPKPDEAVATVKSEVVKDVAAKAPSSEQTPLTLTSAAGLKEAEVKVGVDVVEAAAEKTTQVAEVATEAKA